MDNQAVLIERLSATIERLDRMDAHYTKLADREEARDAKRDDRISSLERWRSGVVAIVSLCVGAFGYVFSLLTK